MAYFLAAYEQATMGLTAARLHVLDDVYTQSKIWFIRIIAITFVAIIALLSFGT
jgi:hypothetical protein